MSKNDKVLKLLQEQFADVLEHPVTRHRIVEKFYPVYRLRLQPGWKVEDGVKLVSERIDVMMLAGQLAMADDYDEKGSLLVDVVEVRGIVDPGRGLTYIQVGRLDMEKINGKREED